MTTGGSLSSYISTQQRAITVHTRHLRDRRHTVCRSSSWLSPLVRGGVLSSLKFTRTPQATRRRVYSVGLEPAAMNVAGSAVARVREHCAPAGGTAPPQFQQLDCRTSNTGAEAPSSVCQRRAESPSPGGEQARASTSITARAAQKLVAAGRDKQISCSSRRASTRPAACATLALLRRHRRASASSSGGALARAPANAANACQPLLVASSRRFQIRKTTTFEPFRNSVRA